MSPREKALEDALRGLLSNQGHAGNLCLARTALAMPVEEADLWDGAKTVTERPVDPRLLAVAEKVREMCADAIRALDLSEVIK
jgi:hypothetical protein